MNYMSLKQAAEQLELTPGYLRVAISRGALKAQKLGRDWVVTKAEVQRYDRERRQGRPPKAP